MKYRIERIGDNEFIKKYTLIKANSVKGALQKYNRIFKSQGRLIEFSNSKEQEDA